MKNDRRYLLLLFIAGKKYRRIDHYIFERYFLFSRAFLFLTCYLSTRTYTNSIVTIEDNWRSNETMRCNLSHDFIIENNYIIYTIESYLYSLILNIQVMSYSVWYQKPKRIVFKKMLKRIGDLSEENSTKHFFSTINSSFYIFQYKSLYTR